MTLQEFIVASTRKAATDVEAALNRLPTDKRNYSVGGQARTAADMVAECAINNGVTADVVVHKKMGGEFDYQEYLQTKAALAQNPDAMHALLKANTEKFVAAVAGVATEDLNMELDLPWGAMTVAQLIAYPYWNMSYHEGQINLIAATLE